MLAAILTLLPQFQEIGRLEGAASVVISTEGETQARFILGGIKNGQAILTLSDATDPLRTFWPAGRAPASDIKVSGNSLTWRQATPGRSLTRTFTLHRTAARIYVRTEIAFDREGTVTGPLLSQYRFVAAPADSTTSYFPPSPATSVLTDDRFLSPIAAIAGNGVRAIVIPDLNELAVSRPLPATLYGSGTAINYGFHTGLQRTKPGVYEVTDPAATRRMPATVSWGETIILSKPPAGSPVTAGLSSVLWEMYGRPRLLRSAFPQEAPLLYYTKPTYDFPISIPESDALPEASRKSARQWWEKDVDGRTIGAPSGQETIRWGVLDNSLRAAWAMKWWGRYMKQSEWGRKGEAMLNLALRAPGDSQGFSTSYHRVNDTWDTARSLPEMAETGRWYVRWLDDFVDLPQSKQIQDRVTALAKYCIGQARPDGSYRSEDGAPIIIPQVTSFLVAYSMSTAVENQPVKALAKQAVRDTNALEQFGESFVSGRTQGSLSVAGLPAAYALMMKSRVTQDVKSVQLAGRVLRRLALDQSVWTMPYRPGKDTFGTMPATGQYDLTASHAAMIFVATGAALGDRELMERGAAALRSPLDAGVGPSFGTEPTDRPLTGFLGRIAGSFGTSQTDAFGTWPGFEAGEGQVLASIADVLAQYGDFYRHGTDWAVGFNGLMPNAKGQPISLLALNDPPYLKGFPVTITDNLKQRTQVDSAPAVRQIRRIRFEARPEGIFLVAEPAFLLDLRATTPGESEFVYANGKTTSAKMGPNGWEALADRTSALAGPIGFRTNVGEDTLVARDANIFLRPILRASALAPRGWIRTKDLADCGFPTDWLSSLPWLSTADDGSGLNRPTLIGEIRSVEFIVTEPAMRMEIRGTAGATIELIDSATGEALESYEAGSGQKPETLEWELSVHQGKLVTIRLKDSSPTAWIAATGFEFLTASQSADTLWPGSPSNHPPQRHRLAEPRR